jgi:hypothetical protein
MPPHPPDGDADSVDEADGRSHKLRLRTRRLGNWRCGMTMRSPAPGPPARNRDAAAAARGALLADFSLDITSSELGELASARAVIPAGTPVQLAFPDGADLAERVSTAGGHQGGRVCTGADHRGAPAPVAEDAPGLSGRLAGGGRERTRAGGGRRPRAAAGALPGRGQRDRLGAAGRARGTAGQRRGSSRRPPGGHRRRALGGPGCEDGAAETAGAGRRRDHAVRVRRGPGAGVAHRGEGAAYRPARAGKRPRAGNRAAAAGNLIPVRRRRERARRGKVRFLADRDHGHGRP